MMILVSYDVASDTGGAGRLRRIAKHCGNFGIRVQYSVFECEVDPAQWTRLRAALLDVYDPEQDSLRFYHLGASWRKKVEHHGAKASPDIFQGCLIV